jgi:hypothetical protein
VPYLGALTDRFGWSGALAISGRDKTDYTPGIEWRGYSTAVNRRDFLLFRTDGAQKTVDLSCERLYMHYRDAQTAELPPEPDVENGEPPARFTMRTTRQLFADLAADLAEADVLRVTHAEWLAAADDFRHEVERLATAIRARGARVEYK